MVHAKLTVVGIVLASSVWSSDLDAPASPEPAGRGEIVCKPAPAYEYEGRDCSPSIGCPAPTDAQGAPYPCLWAICDPVDFVCTTTPHVGSAMPCGMAERCIWGMCCHDE